MAQANQLIVPGTGSAITGSGKTPTTVVSYKSQLKLIDSRVKRQLQELEDKRRPDMQKGQAGLDKMKRKLELMKSQFIQQYPEPHTSQDNDRSLAYKSIQEHAVEIMEVEFALRILVDNYDHEVNSIIKRGTYDKEEIQILMDEANEQKLDSEDEDKVKSWDQGNHQFNNAQVNGEQADFVNPPIRERQTMNDHWYNYGPQPIRNFGQAGGQANDSSTDIVSQLTVALGKAFGNGNNAVNDLPMFSGKAEEWPLFKREYDRTMVNYQSGQNASRLGKALKGQARDAVIGLLDDPTCVGKVMQMLEMRFGRSEFIIESLINKVRQCKAPDPNKPEMVVNFGSVIQQLVFRVKSLKKNSYLYNPTLIQEMVNKLPMMYAEQWINYLEIKMIDDPSLEHFGDWMESKVNRVVRLCKATVTEIASDKKPKEKKSSVIHTTESNVIANDKAKQECVVCHRDNHKTGRCWIMKKKELDERWKIAKENKLCFVCLDRFSRGHAETCSDVCGIDGCTKKHHRFLHSPEKMEKGKKLENFPNNGDDSPKPKKAVKTTAPEEDDEEPTVSSTIKAVSHSSSKPLSVVSVRIRGPKGIRKTFALLDSGADVTAVDEKLCEELGLIVGDPFTHNYKGVSGASFSEKAWKVKCEVAGDFKGAVFYTVADGVTVTDLGLNPYTMKVQEVQRKFPYLKRAKLKDMDRALPQLIIGEDHPHLSAHREILERNFNEPMAKRTKLGWVIAGKKISEKSCINSIHALTECNMTVLDKMIKESFSLASFGVVPRPSTGSLQDKLALEILEQTTLKAEDRWECGLLWKENDIKLPPSKTETIARLVSNEKRMKRDAVYADMYHKKIMEYMEKDYIRKLSHDEAEKETNKTWYLPHFGVSSINKPGKLRLVFDAASKANNVSLNDVLLTGPDLIRPLLSVLWNFRKHNIVITGDIEDMFHRVMIRQEDRNSQRFLWKTLEQVKQGKDPDVYIMNVMIFGACSSPASAIFVKNKNASYYQETYSEAARATVEDFYVDDCLTGAPTPEEAIRLQQEITAINACGGFMVKKWLSNSKQVLDAIPKDARASGAKDFGMKSVIPTERVLGMWWNPTDDNFTFNANFGKVNPEILEGRRPTKREVCSLVMSLFDPMGFVNNFKIKGMIILQLIWKSGVQWDDEITDTIYEEWKIWLESLKTIENVKIPRLYCNNVYEVEKADLHIFMDASEEAYAAVAYLRFKKNCEIKIAFVASKVRVSPIKKLTIPRLELLAAVLGTRLALTIKEELKLSITGLTMWTDARTVLLWIRSETLRLKEFVANRIGEIHDGTNTSDWRWIPTSMNIADEATRLKKQIILSGDSEWLNGPPFLLQDETTWPAEKSKLDFDYDESEVKSNKVYVTLRDELEVSRSTNERCGLKSAEATTICPDANRFSSFTRLVRSTACVIAAAKTWKLMPKAVQLDTPWNLTDNVRLPKIEQKEKRVEFLNRLKIFLRDNLRSNVMTNELVLAEMKLVMTAQAEVYSDEIRNLRKNGRVSKQSSLRKLSPFLDKDGVMRVEGRIQHADSTLADVKQPPILPARHKITELIVKREHELNAHQGLATVFNNLRQRYWIVDGRAVVRRVFSQCQTCKNDRAKPIIPKMGNLPSCRLAAGEPPFTHTGVDFFGPIEVTVGRHHEKRWGALFTCMVTRAIHLEAAYGLSSDEMMLVLSRFVDSRGRPRHIYSDNGTNFVGSNKELKEAWSTIDWKKIVSLEKMHPIDWNYLPSYSPHMAGAWERMVQAVKKILKKTLHEKFPKDQVLLTVLKGAENLINSRPLTYVSGDPMDPESITPNHFLRGAYFVGPSIPGTYDVEDEILRKNWKRAQVILEQLWQRWTKEYLPELNRREKWLDTCTPIEVGEIVLLVDEHQPRNMWVKGVVTATFPGNDGQVRVVSVTTRDFSSKRTSTYRRSVDRVVPLDLKMEI